MLELLSSTGIVLIVIFVLLTLIYLLILFIIIVRIIENYRASRQRNFVKRWEEKIFEYLASDISPREIIKLFPQSSFKYLLQNLRHYLLTLKGKDKEKLCALVNETELFDFLMKQLNSTKNKRIVFGAYYLGLAKALNSEFILKKKLKTNDDLVFITCALSLARVNSINSVDDIFEQFSRRKNISRDTLLTVLFEYDESVCEVLLMKLEEEKSAENRAIIISTLRHFQFSAAAPIILRTLLHEKDSDVIIEALKYFGKIEYLDAATSLRLFLLNPRPDIKTAAIKASLKVGDKSLEDRIWDLIYDKNRYVKVTAAEAMYSFSERSRQKLEQLAYRIPNTIESSIARMIISEKTIHQT